MVVKFTTQFSLAPSATVKEKVSPAHAYLSDSVVDSVLDELEEATSNPSRKRKQSAQDAVTGVLNSIREKVPSNNLEDLLGALDQMVLPPKAKTEPNPRPTREPQPQTRFLIFQLDPWQMAIPLDQVMEVGNLPASTWVPYSPEWMPGVAHLRGEIYSLVDFRLAFQLADSEHTTKQQMILTRTQNDDMRTVLIVDRVLGIRNLALPDTSPTAWSLSSSLDPFVKGVDTWQNQPLVFLDLNALLRSKTLHDWQKTKEPSFAQ